MHFASVEADSIGSRVGMTGSGSTGALAGKQCNGMASGSAVRGTNGQTGAVHCTGLEIAHEGPKHDEAFTGKAAEGKAAARV